MKNIKHSVRYNFIMNFILTASQFIFPLVTFPYVSRILLVSGNGKVAFASSVANYFLMVASLGIPTYGIRACVQVRDDRAKLTKTVHEIFIINFIMTILVIFTYMICIFIVPRFASDKILFLINGINIILNIFGMNWFYQALEQYDYITFRSIVFKIISVILMFLLVHQPDDYIVYSAILVFSSVGANIFNFIRIHRYIDIKWIGDYNFKRHLSPIITLFAQNLAVSVYTNLDTVMLGFLKSDDEVGYYNAAVKVKSILISLVTSLGNVLLPRMSYYVMQKKRREFLNMMLKALNFTVLLSFPLVFYFDIFAKESIMILAGDSYLNAVLVMQIITISVIPVGITGVLGVQVLTALENERYVLNSVIVGAAVDFFLNLIFIPLAGASGAAFATVIAEFMVFFVQLFYTRKLIKLIKNRFRIHIYFVLSLLSGLVSFSIKKVNISSDFLIMLLSACVFFGIYTFGLLIVKEAIVLEVVNSIKAKIRK